MGAVDDRIRALPTWQGQLVTRVRKLARQAVPAVEEQVKWRKPSNAMLGVLAWSHDGLLFTGEPYKDKVKFTFAKGGALESPLFNTPGKTRRAIDVFEGDTLDAKAFAALVKAAAALNAE